MGLLIARLVVASILGTIGYIYLGPCGSIVGVLVGFLFTSIEGADPEARKDEQHKDDS